MKLIISDEELNKSLSPIVEKEKVLLPELVDLPKGGQKNKLNPLSKELAALEAATAINVSQREIGQIHGMSQQTVSHLSLGYNQPNLATRKEIPELKDKIERVRGQVVSNMTEKLLKTSEIFEPAELEQKDLPNAMSKIAFALQKLGDKHEKDHSGVQFVIYAPQIRNENEYKTIVINE